MFLCALFFKVIFTKIQATVETATMSQIKKPRRVSFIEITIPR